MQQIFYRENQRQWWGKQKILWELSVFYRVHINTIAKIVARWKHGDFSIHKSIRNDYRCVTRGLRKQSKTEQRILKVRARKEGIHRYEKQYAGELGHIDVHKAKNIKGQDPKKKKYVATLIDDATRIAYSRILSNKKA